jgi:hypothetical protein
MTPPMIMYSAAFAGLRMTGCGTGGIGGAIEGMGESMRLRTRSGVTGVTVPVPRAAGALKTVATCDGFGGGAGWASAAVVIVAANAGTVESAVRNSSAVW